MHWELIMYEENDHLKRIAISIAASGFLNVRSKKINFTHNAFDFTDKLFLRAPLQFSEP